ncbi:MAG: OmpA family protein [Flavisolibacter sp.]
MKKLLLFLCVFALVHTSQAQILKKMAERAKQKIEQKMNEKVDKTVDKTFDKTDGKSAEGEDADDNNGAVLAKNTADGDAVSAQPASLKTYSRYDFVQGEKVIAFDNFERTDVGDFPTSWNTNGSAEVVTLNNKEGKWLRITNRGVFYPEFIKDIPENSTLEFDLGVKDNFQWGSSSFYVYITHLDEKDRFAHSGYYGHHIRLEFHPMTGEANKFGGVTMSTGGGKGAGMSNHANIRNWNNKTNLFAHVSIWRQGQRMRMYVNGDKILDLPRAFEAGSTYSDLIFETYTLAQEKEDYYLVGNIRVATGKPDTRNKLITEGRFVTSGITFDVNSDKIKPESFGVLKEIATALTENPSVKVKIIGHTDSDGEADKNLELSKKRAASVKAALASEFGVDASRLETDGLGETKPVGDNATTEGKAQNRRVEFVKL